MTMKDLTEFLNKLGFKDLTDFKKYKKSQAKLNEYGAICYTENKQGYELNYSNNCLYPYHIGCNNKGIFETLNFKN